MYTCCCRIYVAKCSRVRVFCLSGFRSNFTIFYYREWLYAEGLKDIEVAYRYRSIILRAWFQRCKDALDHEHNIFYITLN